jgi:hypothetical protein
MTFWVAGAAIVGGGIAAYGSNKAAQTQASAARETAAVQSDVADRQLALQKRQYEEGVQRQQPFLTAGTNALARMQSGEFTPPAAFSFGVNDFQADPGYAFRLSEGTKALERSAAARGGLISGGALKAATRYGQDMGSQEFGNAYSRALTSYNANVARSDTGYNRLAGMAGVGLTTTRDLNTAGANYASGASNTLGNYGTAAGNAVTAVGNANAAGTMGTYNTLAGGLTTAASGYQNQKNFNDYLASRRLGYGGGGVQNAEPYMPGLRA